MSRIVMGPGLDWTIVRFLAPKDGPTKGNVRYGFYGTDKLHLTITRADISAFTAEQVEDLRHVGRAVGISN